MSEAIIKVTDGPGSELEANIALKAVQTLIENLLQAEGLLEHGYAKLGYLLTEVSEHRYWLAAGFESFGEYIKSLSEKYNRGRTQLYHYFSTVKELKPYLKEAQLNEMGIAKANEIRKSVKQTGFPPKDEIIEQALKPEVTTAIVRKLLFESTNRPPDEKGTWMDFEGFYVTPDERLVINSAFEAAWRTDPVVQKDVPAWVRRKEAILRMAMEFLAEHGDKSERGEA